MQTGTVPAALSASQMKELSVALTQAIPTDLPGSAATILLRGQNKNVLIEAVSMLLSGTWVNHISACAQFKEECYVLVSFTAPDGREMTLAVGPFDNSNQSGAAIQFIREWSQVYEYGANYLPKFECVGSLPSGTARVNSSDFRGFIEHVFHDRL